MRQSDKQGPTGLALEFGLHNVVNLPRSSSEADALANKLVNVAASWEAITEFAESIKENPEYGDNQSKAAHVRHVAEKTLSDMQKSVDHHVRKLGERIKSDRDAALKTIGPQDAVEQAQMAEIRATLRSLSSGELAKTINRHANDSLLQRTVATSPEYLLAAGDYTRNESLTRAAELAGENTVNQLFNAKVGNAMIEQAGKTMAKLQAKVNGLPRPKVAPQKPELPQPKVADVIDSLRH